MNIDDISDEKGISLAQNNSLTDLKQSSTNSKRYKLPLDVLQLDVSNDKSVKDAINIITEKHGRINAVVNNAGYGRFIQVRSLQWKDYPRHCSMK